MHATGRSRGGPATRHGLSDSGEAACRIGFRGRRCGRGVGLKQDWQSCKHSAEPAESNAPLVALAACLQGSSCLRVAGRPCSSDMFAH